MSPNRFDDKAATWDEDPAKVERAAAVARDIASIVPLKRSTRMLEYGAGTGLVSQALQGSVGVITLADSSAGMREVMQAKVDSGALHAARIWDLDLTASPAPSDAFDLIVTVMTLHHIPDLPPVLEQFAALLVPGGHLCIADLEKEDGSFHGADFDGHHGFERPALERDLRDAGFTNISFTACTEMIKHGATYQVFLATCVR